MVHEIADDRTSTHSAKLPKNTVRTLCDFVRLSLTAWSDNVVLKSFLYEIKERKRLQKLRMLYPYHSK